MVSEALRPAAGILAVVVLCSAAEALVPSGGFDYVRLCACLAISAVAVEDVSSLVSMGRETIEQLCDFSHILLPTLCTTAAAAGAISSAAVKYSVSAMFSDILLTVSQNLIIPLICGYTACLTASSAIGGNRMKGAVRLLKWTCRTVLCALAGVFGLWLNISGVAASGADAAAVKTAKTVISAALPVVGRMVADTAESLVAGAGLIRGAAGVFGMGVTAAMCILPVMRLGLRYVVFKAAAAVASAAAGDRLSGLIDGIAGAYGMVLGLVGTGAAIMFISIMSFIKAVS